VLLFVLIRLEFATDSFDLKNEIVFPIKSLADR
jgi:hypothetical protein